MAEHTLTRSKASGWSKDATRQLTEGFNRRLLMIEAGYQCVRDAGERRGEEPLSVYEATDLAIQINAFYMNMVGALDNLAWALQYELHIVPETTEFKGKQMQIGLFTRIMRRGIKGKSPALAALLEPQTPWYAELRKLRDPAAYRIPIYPPPGIQDEESRAEWERLHAEARAHFEAGRFSEGMNLQHVATRVGKYEPWMSLPTPSGHKMWHMVGQATTDYDQLLEVSKSVLTEVFGLARHGADPDLNVGAIENT